MYEHTLIYSALRYNTYEIVNHTRHCLHLFLVYAYYNIKPTNFGKVYPNSFLVKIPSHVFSSEFS